MVWSSSEQLYQALKFKSEKYRDFINKQQDIQQIYHLGQSREHALIDNFEEKKFQLMFTANWEKFTQNPELGNILKSTSGKIEFRRSSPFWNHHNSIILTIIRKALQYPR